MQRKKTHWFNKSEFQMLEYFKTLWDLEHGQSGLCNKNVISSTKYLVHMSYALKKTVLRKNTCTTR